MEEDFESAKYKRFGRLAKFLEAHFSDVELHMPDVNVNPEDMEQGEDNEPSFFVHLDNDDARINLVSMASP